MTSLADDEHTLNRLAHELADGIDGALHQWVRNSLTSRAAMGGVAVPDGAAIDRCAQATRELLAPAVREALATDVDSVGRTPLDVVRAGVGPMTTLLAALGAAQPPRDEFVAQAFPDDPYDLGPASFGDIDPSLQEPGIAWGAARAHVHLRRRRERGDG